MTQPLVSIIVPHYNRAALISETIESVKRQLFANWELIVVDDRSDVDQVTQLTAICEFDTRIKLLQRQSGVKGPSVCRNEGVAAASGEFVLFLDSDDLLAEHCLQNRVGAMQDSGANLGIFLMQEFSQRIGDSDKVYNQVGNKDDLSLFLQNINPWNVTCPMWRKDFFLSLGGFNEDFFFMEDPEIHVRALLSADVRLKKFYHLPVDSYYRVNNFDTAKTNFYHNSIAYRTLFYQRTWEMMPAQKKDEYKKDFRKGIMNMLHGFVYARMQSHARLFEELISWLGQTSIFSPAGIVKIRMGGKVFGADHKIVHLFRLKGFYKRFLQYSVR